MTIENLRCFLVLADELNYTRAAERTHTSQTAMSRRISTMEEELGFQLFERTHHSVRLTPSGQHFSEKIRPLVYDYDAAVLSAKGESDFYESGVKVGIGAYEHLLLNPAMPGFLASHPIRKISLQQFTYFELMQNFLNNQLDLILTSDQFFPTTPMDGIVRILINTDPWGCAVNRSNPLARKAILTREDISRENLVTMHTGTLRNVQHALLTQGLVPASIDYVNSMDAKLLLIQAGRGVGMFPSFMDFTAYPDIVLKQLDPPDYYRKFYLLYKESNPNPVTFQLIEYLRSFYGIKASGTQRQK